MGQRIIDIIKKKKLIIQHIKHNYKDFLITKTTTLANQIILDEITKKMQQANFSRKIIERTYIKSIKYIDDETLRINIVSDFVSESGFSVSLARELGTDNNKPGHQHWVIPKTKKVLSWIQNGKRMFSKGHRVTGIESLHIISKTIDEQRPKLVKELQKAINDWKKSI